MTERVALTAKDGNDFEAYVARPEVANGLPVVILQEIFGVNEHIRSVADSFAERGYLAIAPALFDRKTAGLELDYDAAGIETGRQYAIPIMQSGEALNDIEAALIWGETQTGVRPAIVGYCFGGTLAWQASAKLNPACSVCYYGGQIPNQIDLKPLRPVMMHFGARDEFIPLSDVDRIKAKHPDLDIFVYDAGHGFNCDARSSYHEQSAQEALARTLSFVESHMHR